MKISSPFVDLTTIKIDLENYFNSSMIRVFDGLETLDAKILTENEDI